MGKFFIVVPTIRLVSFWKEYEKNFAEFDHNNAELVVVSDYCKYDRQNKALLKEASFPCQYWSVKRQQDFFKDLFRKRWKHFWSVIPHRSDTCRSFGYLISYMEKPSITVTIDDDNYPVPGEDFLGGHGIVGKKFGCGEVSSSNGWFNTYEVMNKVPDKNIFARGHPYSKRGGNYSYEESSGTVVLNHGLETNNPDFDAVTTLCEGGLDGIPKTKTTSLRRERLFIGPGTFCPVNTANTAFSSAITPCYYDMLQGKRIKVNGSGVDRYGDIWAGVFAKKVIDAVGGKVCIGRPLVEHRRVPRDVFNDIRNELFGLSASQKLFEKIDNIEIGANDYFEGYRQLILGLRSQQPVHAERGFKKYFSMLFDAMETWLEIIEKIE